MDVLSSVLTHLELRTTRYFRVQVGGAWGVQIPPQQGVIRFHVVLSGACTLTLGDETKALGPGDLAFVPRGLAHGLSDAPRRRMTSLGTVLRRSPVGPTGILSLHPEPSTELLCGHMTLRSQHHPLLVAMPDHVVVQSAEASWLPALVAGLWRELREELEGSAALIDRLVEVVLIQALRELVRTRADVPFARALGDPAIARCLQAFHADPAADFSIAELARLAALSRTTFCERFRETVGLSPADYMTRWRLDLAARYLAQDARLSVDEVAARVGYQSQAAFSRAFARHHGMPPSRLRSGTPAQAHIWKQ
ncbi:MAG: AraC family transcriptional regulator [Polyangiales bacterium]|nr:AraC family transcriptional regulator [Myxococcales bacterium]MCB9657497.1 AraC family transcriptional regulator [Sandaracinaceae bacterium]